MHESVLDIYKKAEDLGYIIWQESYGGHLLLISLDNFEEPLVMIRFSDWEKCLEWLEANQKE